LVGRAGFELLEVVEQLEVRLTKKDYSIDTRHLASRASSLLAKIQPELGVRLRPDQLTRYNLTPVEVLTAIQGAFEGSSVAQIYEGNRSTTSTSFSPQPLAGISCRSGRSCCAIMTVSPFR
jgi:hypothetical protein